MEFIQLEAFERAAREGSFTRAAEVLGLTQPAVSLRITALEAELGGQLFERRGRQLSLTPLGQRFLPYVQRILSVIADSAQVAREVREGRLGEVRIAAPTPFLLGLMVDALVAYRHQHPKMDVRIRERDKKTILQMLYDNVITLGLVNAPVYDGRFRQVARFRDPVLPVVGAGHPLAGAGPIRMETLYQYTIFRVSMFPQMTAFIDTLVEDARQGSGGAVIAVPMVMALRLILRGEGVTFLPESYVRATLEAGTVTQLEIEDMPPLIGEPVLIAHKSRDLDDVHQEFARVFKSTWRHLLVE
ncbi:MAG: LysR family transcriptional regulator [Chloroflexota bacterium]